MRSLIPSSKRSSTVVHVGFSAFGVDQDPDTFVYEFLQLDECRRNTPHLAVVEENLANMSGIHFILDLLKVSWTTATILVSDRDDEAIHEATEGLGILGHINGCEDLVTLEDLLKTFEEVMLRA